MERLREKMPSNFHNWEVGEATVLLHENSGGGRIASERKWQGVGPCVGPIEFGVILGYLSGMHYRALNWGCSMKVRGQERSCSSEVINIKSIQKELDGISG